MEALELELIKEIQIEEKIKISRYEETIDCLNLKIYNFGLKANIDGKEIKIIYLETCPKFKFSFESWDKNLFALYKIKDEKEYIGLSAKGVSFFDNEFILTNSLELRKTDYHLYRRLERFVNEEKIDSLEEELNFFLNTLQ